MPVVLSWINRMSFSSAPAAERTLHNCRVHSKTRQAKSVTRRAQAKQSKAQAKDKQLVSKPNPRKTTKGSKVANTKPAHLISGGVVREILDNGGV